MHKNKNKKKQIPDSIVLWFEGKNSNSKPWKLDNFVVLLFLPECRLKYKRTLKGEGSLWSGREIVVVLIINH